MPDDLGPDVYAGCTTDEDRLTVEKGLVTTSDNSPRPEDGEQPVEVDA